MTGRRDDKGSKRPTARSREMRRNMTEAEQRLWYHLRARQVADTRFNSQFPVGPFTCDCVARTPKLIVEVDGGQHAEQERRDVSRSAYLESRGYRVIRFWNNEVLANTEGVIQAIAQVLDDRPSPSPSRKREGS
jgi:very-short-patch-repair endonuclease